MSFQDKSFWIGKSTDGDPAFDSPSGIEPKRSHQWFLDAEEHELFPNKKQALENLNSTSSSEIAHATVPSWDSTSGFPSVPNQFMHQLFGSETTSPVSFSERNLCPAGTDNSDASVSLSMSHAMEDSEGCFSYGAFRKVKVNEVKDSDNTVHAPKGCSYTTESSNDISPGQAFTRESESSFTSIGQAYDKEDDSVTLMGQCYNRGDDHIGSASPSYGKGDGHPFSMGETYTKDCTNMIYFGGFHEAQDIIPGRPIGSYDLYIPSAIQTPEAFNGKELEASSVSADVRNIPASKSKPESAPKNKPELKCGRKEAPNSFPSNVRSLISTGMLDGVPVKYVSLSREELRGIIKGSGYLCGCESCNYTKVLNAYEFERHAGCKTKHPNNHIYFENGKTIYQIVQELRSTPESMLFDVIQTVFGAPINQKSFRIWKESFQAATRELQRIYGKDGPSAGSGSGADPKIEEVELPSFFMSMPTELKMKFLESLPGADIAKMGRVCAELQSLSSDNDLWKQKFEEEFGSRAVQQAVGRGAVANWKEKFASHWKGKKYWEEAMKVQQSMSHSLVAFFKKRANLRR